jgi:hypothetical protein
MGDTANDVSRSSSKHDDNSSNNTDSTPDHLLTAEEYYSKYGYGNRMIFAMCIGLKETTGDAALIDIESEPWKSMKKSEIKAKKQDVLDEVYRRYKGEDLPKADNWSVKRCILELEKKPITDAIDVAFLRAKVKEMKELQLAVQAESQAVSKTGHWTQEVPYLRLILCLIQDDIKPKWLSRAQPLTRQQLDGRNSEVRDETVYEMISDHWNSPTFNPQLDPSPIHFNYRNAIPLGHSTVAHLTEATPEKVKFCAVVQPTPISPLQ